MAQQLIMMLKTIVTITKIKTNNMKKLIVLALVVLVSTVSFAQKKELKTASKAISKSNYAEAKAALSQAKGMMSSMDDKQKSQYNLLMAQTLYANGAATDSEISEAVEYLNNVDSDSYESEAQALRNTMQNAFLSKANDLYTQNKFGLASSKFEQLYRVVPADTTYLYYAAVSSVANQDYETALDYYIELDELGYTGIQKEYFAVNKETGEEEVMDKNTRDIYIKSGDYIKAGERFTESKSAEITKNIALIYVQLDKKDEAIAAIKKARKNEPENIDLILTEANMQLKLENTEEYKALIQEALAIDPNNLDLIFNLGVLSAEAGDNENAKKYYKQVVDQDPTYVNAQTNMAALILSGEQAIIEEMNGLGNSSADNKRYDELKNERMEIYNEAIPYLEGVLKVESDNLQAAKTLMNIYSATGDTENFKAMKAKVQELSGN